MQQVAVVVQLVALLDWCGFCGPLGVVLPTRAHPSCRKKVQERIRQRVHRPAVGDLFGAVCADHDQPSCRLGEDEAG